MTSIYVNLYKFIFQQPAPKSELVHKMVSKAKTASAIAKETQSKNAMAQMTTPEPMKKVSQL